MKRKKIALSLAVAMLVSSMVACCMDQPIHEASSTDLQKISSNITDFEEQKQPESFQVAKDINVIPLLANKVGTDMTDDEIKRMAEKLFENCNTIWFSLCYGISDTVLDKSKACLYDGDKWYKMIFASSFEEYKNIINSSFEYKVYTEFIYPDIKHSMREEDNMLYYCRSRAGEGSPPPRITPLKITVIEKESDKIVLRVMVKEAKFTAKDGELIAEDGEKIYTVLKQNGYWVLDSFYGKSADESNLGLSKFEDTISPKERKLALFARSLCEVDLVLNSPAEEKEKGHFFKWVISTSEYSQSTEDWWLSESEIYEIPLKDIEEIIYSRIDTDTFDPLAAFDAYNAETGEGYDTSAKRYYTKMIGGYGSLKTFEVTLFEKNSEFIHVELLQQEDTGFHTSSTLGGYNVYFNAADFDEGKIRLISCG